MLDPEYLKHCTDELEDLFSDLETSILQDVARRIAQNEYINTSTAAHQLNRAKALGLHYDEAKKKIAKMLELSEEKVSSIITEASYGSIAKDNVIFKEAYEKGIIHRFNYDEAAMRKLILAGIKSTNGEIRNICKTTAKTSKKLLSDALDMTYLSVQSGAFSQQEAVKVAVQGIAKKGITWIDYESGAHRRVDSTVRTAIRTGVNQTACKCQDRNFEEMGGNLVEVTSHMGARPSHAQWQGKIYWRKKQYKNYQNFEQATGYGTGAGLGGWNCRHSFYPYFEGLSSKSFEHYRLTDNEERYELDQQQRYNERQIREWKRRQAVNRAGGVDSTREGHKVREWQQRQSNLLKSHPELKRNFDREKMYKAGGFQNKIHEFYATDNKDVKMRVLNRENRISKKSYEEAYLYDQKGNVLLHKTGLRNEVSFSDAEIALMKNGILTHNHPLGTTFSPDDIYMAIVGNLQEIRAVTSTRGTYVLRRNENLHLMPDYDEFNEEYKRLYFSLKRVYKQKYPDWQSNRDRMEQIVQDNAMNRTIKKYGLNCWRETDENI